MRLPPLKTLPVFEAVARLGSFTRAAQALHVSQSAVSHSIAQLEAWLGESLFERRGRQIALTEQGSVYYEQISAALIGIQRAGDQLRGEEGSQLRLAVYSSFAVCWLIPRLPLWRQEYSQIDLDLEMLSAQPRMSDRLADCYIAINPRQPGYESQRLYSERLFPVCSRRYWLHMQEVLGGCAPPESLEPGQLQPFALLSATIIFAKRGEDWRRWFQAGGAELQGSTRVQHFSHMLLAHEAARHHQGIALSNDYMFDPADPDLIRLPCHSIATGDEFHFACKRSRRDEPAMVRLRRWLQRQAEASGLLHSS